MASCFFASLKSCECGRGCLSRLDTASQLLLTGADILENSLLFLRDNKYLSVYFSGASSGAHAPYNTQPHDLFCKGAETEGRTFHKLIRYNRLSEWDYQSYLYRSWWPLRTQRSLVHFEAHASWYTFCSHFPFPVPYFPPSSLLFVCTTVIFTALLSNYKHLLQHIIRTSRMPSTVVVCTRTYPYDTGAFIAKEHTCIWRKVLLPSVGGYAWLCCCTA